MGNIKGKVVCIDHSADESKVIWDQMLCIIEYKNPTNIQVDTVTLFTIPQIKRGFRWNKKKRAVFESPLYSVV